MADIITTMQVATWARRDLTSFGAFEQMVIAEVRKLVATEAGHLEWLDEDVEVPHRARVIALNVAKRNILNPDQVIQEGSIGPIGGDRVAEDFALGLTLSPAEKAELAGLRGEPGEVNGLWVLPTTNGRSYEREFYVPDDSDSDEFIPFGTVGDIGELDAFGEY